MFSGLEKPTATVAVEREERFLLKAHLVCLLDGVVNGHIPIESARRFRKVFARRLTAAGFLDGNLMRTAKPLAATSVWNEFAATASEIGDEANAASVPHKLSDLRQPGPVYDRYQLVTIAPLQYYDALIREGAAALRLSAIEFIRRGDLENLQDRDTIRDCGRALKCRLFRMPAPDTPFKRTKETTVWVTPLLDEISRLTSPTLPDVDLLPQRHSTTLRNLLGLWSYIGPKTSPLAAFFLAPRAAVHAPNVITASGYPRFRHRTKKFIPMAPTAGLTYNLNRSKARRAPGVEEIVTVDVKMSDVVDVVACGCPDDIHFTTASRMKAFENYWTYLADKRPFAEVLDSLEREIA